MKYFPVEFSRPSTPRVNEHGDRSATESTRYRIEGDGSSQDLGLVLEYHRVFAARDPDTRWRGTR